MFNPCIDHCYLRYGKQYSEECKENCAYAKAVNDIKTVVVDTFDYDKNDYILVKYTQDTISIKELCGIHKALQEQFPNSKVIVLPDNMSVENCGKKNLMAIYEMLKKELCIEDES